MKIKQATRAEAIAIYKSRWWTKYPIRQVALFQLQQDYSCMPFGEFQEAVATAVGHDVYSATLSLMRNQLIDECIQAVAEAGLAPLTVDEIIA